MGQASAFLACIVLPSGFAPTVHAEAVGNQQPSYNVASIASKIGELSGIYPAYAACSGSRQAVSNFENLKHSVEQFFGENAADGLQARFDEMKATMDEMPPTIRRETAIRSDCDNLEQSTASQLNALFTDLKWTVERQG